MSFNNKIIKGLIVSIIILSIMLIVNYFFWNVSIIESFIVSFISGAIVSLFITYIQYKKEKNDIFYYYNNVIAEYYELLNNILLVLNSNDDINEKFNNAKLFFDNYLKNHSSNKKTIELNLILNNLENKHTQKIYQKLYEYSRGIYLLKFFVQPSKKQLNELNRLCEKHIETIDEGMRILTGLFNIDYPWSEYKKTIEFDKH